jgi:hypothetical protein
MTFDQAAWTSSTYLGPAVQFSPDGRTVTIPPATERGRGRGVAPNYKLPTDGGYIVLVNGSNEGSWRRIVGSSNISSSAHTVFEIDQPFETVPSPSSWVQISTFKGQCIFYRNTWSDAGPFNFWGHAIENIVAENSVARIYGMYGTGIFEPWQPASKNSFASQLPQPGSLLLNLRNMFLGNVVRDTNDVPHRLFNCRQLSNDSDCHHLPAKFSSPNGKHAFAIVGQVGCLPSCGNLTQISPPSRFTVLRNNVVHGRGGFLVDSAPPSHAVDDNGRSYGCPGGMADVLLEHNRQVIQNGPLTPGEGFYISPGSLLGRALDSTLLRNNTITTADAE